MPLHGVILRETGQNSSSKSRVEQKILASVSGTKLSNMSRMTPHLKGSVKQRIHPGMISSKDRATAHYRAVTGLKTTEDVIYLLSTESDSRLRLWDIESGCNTLVNYETVRLQNSKGILAVAQDSTLVFSPCMTSVKVMFSTASLQFFFEVSNIRCFTFDLWSGRTSMTFRGHYEFVNCCWYAAQDQDETNKKGSFPCKDEDNWSD